MAELARHVAPRHASRKATIGSSLGRKSQVNVAKGFGVAKRRQEQDRSRLAVASRLNNVRDFTVTWDWRPRLLPATASQFRTEPKSVRNRLGFVKTARLAHISHGWEHDQILHCLGGGMIIAKATCLAHPKLLPRDVVS